MNYLIGARRALKEDYKIRILNTHTINMDFLFLGFTAMSWSMQKAALTKFCCKAIISWFLRKKLSASRFCMKIHTGYQNHSSVYENSTRTLTSKTFTGCTNMDTKQLEIWSWAPLTQVLSETNLLTTKELRWFTSPLRRRNEIFLRFEKGFHMRFPVWATL